MCQGIDNQVAAEVKMFDANTKPDYFATDASTRSQKESEEPTSEAENRLDTIAKICIDVSPEQIDDRLIEVMENFGMLSANSCNQWKQMNAKVAARKRKGRLQETIDEEDLEETFKCDLEPAFRQPISHKCIIEDEQEDFIKAERTQLFELDKKPLIHTEESKTEPIQSCRTATTTSLEPQICEYEPRPLFDLNRPIIDPYDKRTLRFYDEDEAVKPWSYPENKDVEFDWVHITKLNKTRPCNMKCYEEEDALYNKIMSAYEKYDQIVQNLAANHIESCRVNAMSETANKALTSGRGFEEHQRLMIQSRQLYGKDTSIDKTNASIPNSSVFEEINMKGVKFPSPSGLSIPPKKATNNTLVANTAEPVPLVQPQKVLYTVPYSRVQTEKVGKAKRKFFLRRKKLAPKPIPMLQAQETFYATPAEKLPKSLIPTELPNTKEQQNSVMENTYYSPDFSNEKTKRGRKHPTTLLLSSASAKKPEKENNQKLLNEQSSHLLQSILLSQDPPNSKRAKDNTPYYNRDITGDKPGYHSNGTERRNINSHRVSYQEPTSVQKILR